MRTILIEGRQRIPSGTQAAKSLRREGLIPGTIYGAGKQLHFAATLSSLTPVVYTPDFIKVELTCDGQKYSCIVKELQFHKVTDELIHIDLLELEKGKKLKAEIPVKLVGNPVGVKEGGRLVFKVKSLKVITKPEFLPEFIEIDVSNIQIGQNIRVQDVEMEDITILNPLRIPIVGVATTRVLKQEAAAGGNKEDGEEEVTAVAS